MALTSSCLTTISSPITGPLPFGIYVLGSPHQTPDACRLTAGDGPAWLLPETAEIDQLLYQAADTGQICDVTWQTGHPLLALTGFPASQYGVPYAVATHIDLEQCR